MSKSVTTEDVDAFLAKIKAADAEKKVDIVQMFGLTLEDAAELPAHSTDALTLLFPTFLRSSSHLLPQATLTSILPFYIPLLPTSTPHALRLALHQLLAPLLEKVNDPKEKVHQAAVESLAVLGKACYAADLETSKSKDKESLAAAWERGVKDGALSGKGWRGKVEAMKMLQKMRADGQGSLPLKPWLPSLVDLLEDGDQHVREQAKETTIYLLSPSTTPPAARSELKKLLTARNVRKTIAEAVVHGVFNGPSPTSTPATPSETPRSMTPAESSAPTGEVETVYVASAQDVENEFAKMQPHLEGKETEQNWLPREQAALRVRGMLRGGAFQQHPEAFVHGLRSGFMDGLVKILMSLRTTVAQCGCALVQDLAEHLKTSFDPCVECLLPTLSKMAGFTKRIIADKSQKNVTAILTHTSANARLILPFILCGLSEKNVQTRQYFAGHLKTYLDVHSTRSKHAIEVSHAGALQHIETAIKKALADVNPVVKDLARGAFWSFEATWPQQGRDIMDGMDGMALKTLEKADPKGVESSTSPKRPVVAPRRGTSSVAAAIALQRKAKAAALAAERAQAQDGSPARPVARSVESSPAAVQKSSPAIARAPSAPMNGNASSSRMSPSPANRSSPAPQHAVPSTPARPPSSSSSNQARHASQTPEITLRATPRESLTGLGVQSQPVGFDDDNEMELLAWNKTLTPSRPGPGPGPSTSVNGADPAVEEALKSQADQAVSAARRLLDFDDVHTTSQPSTPLRPINGHLNVLRTPINPKTPLRNVARAGMFEDSPRPGALTPAQLHKIQERVKSRRWWIRARKIPDSIGIPSLQHVDIDIDAVTSSTATVDQLLSLRRFAFENSLTPSDSSTVLSPSPLVNGTSAQADSRAVWQKDDLFDRLMQGLLIMLDSAQPKDVLELSTELLCDLVHNQWELMEDRDMAVCEAVFRVRASDAKIHDPTDAIMEFTARVSDPVYYAGTVLAVLDRYLQAHSNPSTRLSGFVLGLTAISRLVMRLPKEIAEDMVERFAPILYKAFNESSALIHESAMNLVLALQSSLRDKERLFKLLPQLKQETRSLAMYYMSRLQLDDDAPAVVDDLAEELGKLEVEKRMNHLESRTSRAHE